MSAILLPKVFPSHTIHLGHLTKDPLHPTLESCRVPPHLLAEISPLLSTPHPSEISKLYLGIERKNWLSVQPIQSLGIENEARSGTLLVLQGGKTTYRTFTHIWGAFKKMIEAPETKIWINRIAEHTRNVYFVTATVNIADAEAISGKVRNHDSNGYAEVPLEQLGQKSMELWKTGFDLTDFGLGRSKKIKGVLGVEFYKVMICLRRKSSEPIFMENCVSWDRPGTLVEELAGRGGQEVVEVRLGREPELEELIALEKLAIEAEMREEMEDASSIASSVQ